MEKIIYQIGQEIYAINTKPLPGKEVAPPLNMYEKYKVMRECFDSEGNQHLDVGLISSYNYIKSFETGEELPNGEIIHWCHPSRFSTEIPQVPGV